MRTIDERVAYYRAQNWYPVAKEELVRLNLYSLNFYIRSLGLSDVCVSLPLSRSVLPYHFYNRAGIDYDNFLHSI